MVVFFATTGLAVGVGVGIGVCVGVAEGAATFLTNLILFSE